jgi:putative endonuclease
VGNGGVPYRVARAVGDYGERVACAHLESRGYQVLDRNWRCRLGELDVVARDGDTLVFCEVKTRRSVRFGEPAEAVTRLKLARLRRLAAAWMQEHDERSARIRIDVLAVVLPGAGAARVDHLEGVA